MSQSSSLTLAQRLGLSFATLILLCCTLGAVALWQLASMNASVIDLSRSWLPSVRASMDMKGHVGDMRRAELQHLLSTDAPFHDRYEKRMAELKTEMDALFAEYPALISSPEEQRLFDDFRREWGLYLAEQKQVVALSRQGQRQEAVLLSRKESQRALDAAGELSLKLAELNSRGAAVSADAADAVNANARLTVLLLLGAATVVGVVMAVVVTRRVAGQLGGEPEHVVHVANRIADGDLTVDVPVRAGDTTSIVAAMRRMRDRLAEVVGQVRASSDNIATGSAQIATGNADLSQRTEEQASNLQQTAASMEQLNGTVQNNAATASQASALAAEASATAERGGEVVGQAVHTMQAIAESSRRIADIIGTIDGIAFQTNILALNAAVEAARAGEQGRGFAVVAGEVRTLAQRSAEAAREIKSLIGTSVDRVEAGTRQVDDAGRSMADIVARVRSVSQMIAEISTATAEQASGIEQVNMAATQLDQVTQQNAALVEESAAAADSLRQQAARLTEVVGVFRL